MVMSIAVGPKPRTAEGFADPRKIAEIELAAVQALAADPANNAVIATDPESLLEANKRGQLGFILGMQNALILGPDVTYIDDLFEAGVRVFALTHMGHNDFADSSRPLFVAATGRREADAEHGACLNWALQRFGALMRLVALLIYQAFSTSRPAGHGPIHGSSDRQSFECAGFNVGQP